MPSPALKAGVRSLLAEDPEIIVVGIDNTVREAGDPSAEVDVIIDAAASADNDSQRIPELSASSAILLLRNERLNIQGLLRASHPWGVLPLEASGQEILAAVHALAAGLIVGFRPLLTADNELTTAKGPLTEREVEILGLLARGLANKQIALELGISEHTVKFHVSSIYTKLNAASRTQAVREGLRNGWIAV